jgi:hypothetical protein
MSPRRLLRPALAGALLALPLVPATASAAEPGVTPTALGAAKPVNEAAAIRDALGGAPSGHRWVRVFADWSQTERTGDDQYDGGAVGGMKARFDALKGTGAKLIVTVQSRPAWAPDPNTDAGASKYAEFMGWMAKEFPQVDVWEMWNEPDDSIFWPQGPQADRYAALIKKAYPAIKHGNPAATVITGGLVGNDYDFVQRLYDNGAGDSFDGVAVHTDTSCRIDAPNVVYNDGGGKIGRFAFTGYREVHATMARNGDADKGIYMTEIGWEAAKDLSCRYGANAGKRSQGVSEADQAAFLKQAFACIAADPYVKVASWFQLQDHAADSRFGLYDYNGRPRDALAALKAVRDGTGAGVNGDCGAKSDSDPPSVTISAPSLYFNRFTTSGTGTDATTSVTKIELWADGKRIMKQNGSRFSYNWYGSSKIAFGAHKIQLRAYDARGNVGIAETTVVRGNVKTAPRTVVAALGIKVKKRGSRFIVAASVKPAADGSFVEQPHGRLELRFEHRVGRTWKRSRVRKGIGDGGVHYIYTARQRGKWRVYGTLVADAPYKRTSTKVAVFRVR